MISELSHGCPWLLVNMGSVLSSHSLKCEGGFTLLVMLGAAVEGGGVSQLDSSDLTRLMQPAVRAAVPVCHLMICLEIQNDFAECAEYQCTIPTLL